MCFFGFFFGGGGGCNARLACWLNVTEYIDPYVTHTDKKKQTQTSTPPPPTTHTKPNNNPSPRHPPPTHTRTQTASPPPPPSNNNNNSNNNKTAPHLTQKLPHILLPTCPSTLDVPPTFAHARSDRRANESAGEPCKARLELWACRQSW